MKMITFLILLTLACKTYCATDLQVGDIILQPLDCHLCTMIESETGTIYSHIGVVISASEQEILVAEAWNRVKHSLLSEFLQKTQEGQSVVFLRHRQIAQMDRLQFKKFVEKFQDLYYCEFLGVRYDSSFLWDNVDESGREKLYCSEFVTKLLNPFLGNKILPTPMSFQINYDDWNRYFRGDVPEEKLGNSPSDFYRNRSFRQLK